MGGACKFHLIRFQVLSIRYRNHFNTILSTFDYHAYLLQMMVFGFIFERSIMLLDNFKVQFFKKSTQCLSIEYFKYWYRYFSTCIAHA